MKTRCIKMGGKLIDRKIRTKVMFHFFFPVQQKILRLLEEFCEFGKKGKNVPLIKWSEDQNNPKIGTRSLNSNYMWTKICVFYVPVLQTKTNNYWCQKFFKNAQKTKCMMWAMTNLQIGVIIDPSQPKKFVNIPIRMANLEIYEKEDVACHFIRMHLILLFLLFREQD